MTAGLLLACGGDDEGVSFAALVEQRETQIDTVCDCFDELGWNSSSGCVNGQNPIGKSMQRCAEEALSEDADVSREYLDCYLELERNYSECLDDRLDCDNTDSLDACSEDYRVGAQDCIELSAKVKRNLEDCGVTGTGLEIKRGNAAPTEPDPNEPTEPGCTNTCEWANDGACDDGTGTGPDDTDLCDVGSDCNDCK